YRAGRGATIASEGPIPSTAERMRVYERTAPQLALEAAEKALAAANVAANAITHLVTVSCTGFSAPGVDVHLLQTLPLSNPSSRTHVGFRVCHAPFNALRGARASVESDRRARVLLCAVELCSQHFYFPWRFDRVIANALFADGAAAIVLGPDSAP